MSTFSRSATSAALRSGRTLKPMMMALLAGGQQHVRLVDGADRRVDDLDLHLVVRQLRQRAGQHFGRALHVGLDDDRQFLDAALGHLLLERLQREPAALGDERLLLGLGLPEHGDLTRLGRVGDRPGTSRRARAAFRARALRPASTGRRVLAGRPRSSMSARTRPTTGPAMKLSPTLSVPSCTSTVATGPRPRSSLVSSTVPDRRALRVGLELADLGDEQNHLEQSVEVGLLLGRDFDEHRRAAPVLRHQADVRQLTLHHFGVGARLVDLVDGDDDRHAGRLGVVDGLAGLRHHAVVGRHHQDDHVGHLGAAGAHQRERLVTGRVEEDDALVLALADAADQIRADVLGDAAGFALGHPRGADRVEQRRLAVVDVAHHRDHRGAGDLVLGVDAFGGLLEQLFFEAAGLDLGAEGAGDVAGRVRCRPWS